MAKRGESKYPQLKNKNWLHNKYLVKKCSALKIAKEVGCPNATVYLALKRQGIGTRSKAEVDKMITKYPLIYNPEWLYQKYQIEKQSTVKIAENLGCDTSTVFCALKRYNFKKRSIGEAQIGRRQSDATCAKISIARTKYSSIQHKINLRMNSAIGKALRGAKRGQHWETIVGYTLMDLMGTLEIEFRDGMTWENHGSVWHIDHIIPLAHFKYNSPDDPEFKKAWSLGNLQPLFVTENLKKGTKFRFY